LKKEGYQVSFRLLATINKQGVKNMTTREKLTRRKQGSLELAEYLQNISQACEIGGIPDNILCQ